MWQRFKNQVVVFFRTEILLSRLLIVNFGLWIAVWMGDFLVHWFTLKETVVSDFVSQWLLLSPNITDTLYKPWTLLTYIFFSDSFFQTLINAIILVWGGMSFRDYFSNKQFVFTYFVGGVFAGLFFLLVANLGNIDFAPATGGFAAVMCIFMSIIAYIPDMPIFGKGKVKLKHLAYTFICLDLLAMLSTETQLWGAQVLNFSAYLFGCLVIFIPKMFKKSRSRMKIKRPKKKAEANQKRPETDEEYNRRRAETDKRIDEILDKISKSGYEKLTSEEKKFLFKTSSKR